MLLDNSPFITQVVGLTLIHTAFSWLKRELYDWLKEAMGFAVSLPLTLSMGWLIFHLSSSRESCKIIAVSALNPTYAV